MKPVNVDSGQLLQQTGTGQVPTAEGTASQRAVPARSGIRPLLAGGAWLAGVFFLGTAALKGLDLSAFSEQIQRYEILPAKWSFSAALLLVVLEALLGLLCIQGRLAKPALTAMMTLLVLFSGATALRWEQLQGTDCGCFGTALSGGPESVFWHNALLLALLVPLTVLHPGRPGKRPWRMRSAAGLAAVIPLLALVAAFSTAQVRPSASIEAQVFLSATCKTCQEKLGRVRALSADYRATPLRIFIGASKQAEIEEFLAPTPTLDFVPLTQSQLAREVEQVPTVRLVNHGGIVRTWVGDVPAALELREQALRLLEPEGMGAPAAENQ